MASELSVRETIVSLLAAAPSLLAAGLPENAIYQADTVESPTHFPFIVIRWGQEVAGVGPVTRRPFSGWMYDEPGDYGRAEKIGKAFLDVLNGMEQTETKDGWISRVETNPQIRPGLGRGEDLYDDGWEAVVIPYGAMAVASGT